MREWRHIAKSRGPAALRATLLWACVAAGVAAFGQGGPDSLLRERFEAAPRDVPPPPLPEAVSAPAGSKLSPELSAWLEGSAASAPRVRTRGRAADSLARAAVRLRASSEAAAAELADRLQQTGGSLHGRIGTVIWAELPPEALRQAAAAAEVEFISRQNRLQLFGGADPPAAAAPSGLEVTQARLLHTRGVTGQGARIGIIDFGFAGRERPGLPRPKAFRRFGSDPSEANTIAHGTACAEIVHSMAPGAELYFAEIGPSEGYFVQAAAWLASEGVHVISFSGGSVEERGDGLDPLSRYVEFLVQQRGILWVNAAGNLAERHWAGETRDADGNGWVDIDSEGRSFLTVRPRTNRLELVLRWDGPGPDGGLPPAPQNVDLIVYREIFGLRFPKPLAESSRRRERSVEPVETLSVEVEPGQIYYVGLRAAEESQPREVHVFVRSGAELHPIRAEGSVMSPATARSVLAVGALDVRTLKVASYSAQGPTGDGRLKPEVVAPAEVPSAALGAQLFGGTSAACAHAAGFAALLHESLGVAGEDLRAAVLRAVRPPSNGPNPRWGQGMIHAAPVAGGAAPTAPEVRYAIQLSRNGDVQAAGPSTEFFTGDEFWLEAELDSPGYLYVVHRSVPAPTQQRRGIAGGQEPSNGEYRLIYPDPAGARAAPGKLPARSPLRIPGQKGVSFRMSGQPGIEKFYLLAAAGPVPLARYFDLDSGHPREPSGKAVGALLDALQKTGEPGRTRMRRRGVEIVDLAMETPPRVVELTLIHRAPK